jgi:hypothetical protein
MLYQSGLEFEMALVKDFVGMKALLILRAADEASQTQRVVDWVKSF